MAHHHTIEIDGELVGILTPDPAVRGVRFHSGIAPFTLLDGSHFLRPADAERAARRIARSAKAPGSAGPDPEAAADAARR